MLCPEHRVEGRAGRQAVPGTESLWPTHRLLGTKAKSQLPMLTVTCPGPNATS